MHDIVITQDAELVTNITVDGVLLTHVLDYEVIVSQSGALEPIWMRVTTHDVNAPRVPGEPRVPETLTMYPVRTLTITTANQGS